MFTFLLIASFIAACTPASPEAESGDTSETVKVGWFGPLSGDAAVWGTADRNGTQLMFEKINAAGGILGKQIEFVYYDDKGDQLESVNVVKRLIQEDKVVAVFGTNGSGRNIAVAPIAEENHVPIIATYSTNPRVTQPTPETLNQYTFRVCFTDPYQGSVMADFAYADLKATKAAIMYDISSDYSIGVREFFKERWATLGGEVVAEEAFKATDVEFRAQLTKIKDANPEVIIMPFQGYKEVALVAKQARDLGITAVMIGGDGWPSSELLKMAGEAVEGSFLVDHTDVNLDVVKEWRAEYKERWGSDMEVNAIMAHDAVLLLQAAIEKAGSFDPEKIAAALTEVQIDGFTGTIKLDPATHNPIGKSAVMMQIKDNKFQFFKGVSPMK
jgi:branched-chain amino acid transport system substrate-binding protein